MAFHLCGYNQKMIVWRILATLFLFVSIFWFPFWLTAIVALVAFFVFTDYYEIFPIFLLLDMVYAQPHEHFWNSLIVHTLYAIVFFYALSLLKKYIIFIKR